MAGGAAGGIDGRTAPPPAARRAPTGQKNSRIFSPALGRASIVCYALGGEPGSAPGRDANPTGDPTMTRIRSALTDLHAMLLPREVLMLAALAYATLL